MYRTWFDHMADYLSQNISDGVVRTEAIWSGLNGQIGCENQDTVILTAFLKIY